ncbi:Inactive glutathione S-transferase D3 [Amphibalanus amphitrite]|uniref:Inactive glutathione S-transferase D3 n=1 Tax=Amphibalanus amphitrite TaxID=1232801 RepID=A0A6A4WLZ1_AMPAM|nr:Inactive glutathione S-transferase D3 [Amphibalanus amphitrite]
MCLRGNVRTYVSRITNHLAITVTRSDAVATLLSQFPVVFRKVKDLKMSQANMPRLEENMALLETFLTRSTYLAGEHLTIADLATLANVSSVEAGGLDMSRWPHVQAWLTKLKAELPYYEQANGEGAQMLGAMYQKALKELGGK